MAFDPHPNLALSLITTAPSPPTTGTTLTVSAGQGGWFQAAPFNATVWPANVIPTPANAEIVRVTARTTDTLTIVRAQEGTTARAIAAGDQIAASITAKTLQDIETQAALLAGANTFTANQTISAPNPLMIWNDTSQPANSRILYWINNSQQMILQAVDDAYSPQTNPLIAARTGDVKVWRDLYEKQRTTPIGHWINGASYIPASWTGTYMYALTGREMKLAIYIQSTLGAPIAEPIMVNLPYAPAWTFTNVYTYYNATWSVGHVVFAATDPRVGFYRPPPGGNFAAGQTYLSLNCTVPIP